MSYSIQRAVSDGTMTLLPVSIEYFDREEISVLFDGVLDARQWAWVGTTEKTLSFTPAVANLVEVQIVRKTDLAELRHQFSLGAQFTAESLDESLIQILHIAQEAAEQLQGTDFYHPIDMHGYKIVNVGDGADPMDVVNHRQMEVHDGVIVGYMNAAGASADAAAASAIAAAASAVDAAGVVTAAEIQFGLPIGHTAVSKDSSTGAARIPAGTTAERPVSPIYGDTRVNSTLDSVEWWDGTAWVAVGGGGTASGTSFTPVGNVVATDVQAAIVELDTEKLQKSLNLSDVPDPATARSNLGISTLTSGTAINTTSGTAHDFTGIPSWVKKITLSLRDVSTVGAGATVFQLGTAGGIIVAGYTSVGSYASSSGYASAFISSGGFVTFGDSAANNVRQGSITFSKVSGNVWVASGVLANSGGAPVFTLPIAGSVDLGAVLTTVRVTNTAGDTFDSGIINILYE